MIVRPGRDHKRTVGPDAKMNGISIRVYGTFDGDQHEGEKR
jgi:hypothetical protein